MSLCVCVLWIDDKGTPSNSFLGQTRTHTLEEDSSLGGHVGPTKHFKGPGVGGGQGLGSAMFRDDRSRSACAGLRPVLGPSEPTLACWRCVRKIIPPQVRVEGSVWCPRAPALGRACRIMLLFPVHGASAKPGKQVA